MTITDLDAAAHDKEIVKAAEALVRAYGQHGPWEQGHLATLAACIAAKQEAMRPQLLTSEQKRVAYSNGYGMNISGMTDAHYRGMDALVEAAYAAAFKVIEALSNSKPGSSLAYHIADIRSALTQGG